MWSTALSITCELCFHFILFHLNVEPLEPFRIKKFPPKHLVCYAVLSRSVMSDSLQPTDCSPPGSSGHGILQARILQRVAMPSSRGSSQPRTEPRSPSLQADSSLFGSPRKPQNTGVASLSLLQGIFPTQELNQGLLHCRWILWAIREAQRKMPFGEFCKHRAIFFPLPPNLYSVNID